MASHSGTPLSVLKRKPLHSENNADRLSDSVDGRNTDVHKAAPTSTRARAHYHLKPHISPSNSLQLVAVLYHFSMTIFYALLLYYGKKLMSDNIQLLDPQGKIPKYGGHFKFLTHINQWLQLGFFGLQFIADLLPTSFFKSKLQSVCDYFFTTIAVPIAFFVAIAFWAIYAVDRQLVYPDRFDLFVPPYMNHFWHTTIALWVIIEILVYYHRFPKLASALILNSFINLAYLTWILHVYQKTGFWVYPILKVLSLPYLLLFFAACISFSLTLYFVGMMISNLRWSKPSYKLE